MAGYSTSSPPALLGQMVGGSKRVWIYESVDAATVVRVDGYITNARDLGMQAGDLFLMVDTDASPIAAQWMVVSAINTDGSADLSDGVAITATNSD